MATYQEILDDGAPPASEDGDTTALTLYAAAIRGLYEAASALGTATRRSAVEVTQAVTTHVAVLSEPGAVIAVLGTGGATGAKTVRPAGTPAAGEVTITYDGDDIPTLTFAVADAITSTTVHQLQVPAGLIEHLNTEAP